MWTCWVNQCAYFKVLARHCRTDLLEGYTIYILNALLEAACFLDEMCPFMTLSPNYRPFQI